MRYLLLAFWLLLTPSVVDAQWLRRNGRGYTKNSNGRYCNNLNCAMCNRLFGSMYSQPPQRRIPNVRFPQSNPNRSFHVVPNMSSPVLNHRVPLPQLAQPQKVYSNDITNPEDRTRRSVMGNHIRSNLVVDNSVPVQQIIPDNVLNQLDPSPQKAVDTMLRILNPTSKDYLYDLGCGDGRILITAASKYGCRGIGIEINPITADKARARVKAESPKKVFVITGDIKYQDLSRATMVTMFLYPQVMAEVIPKLKKLKVGTKILSYNHRIPEVDQTKYNEDGNTYYLWEIK